MNARSSRLLLVLVALPLTLVSQSGSAQTPEQFQNLQVLPKDISREQLTGIMRGFTQALGVRCEFCHMPREAVPGERRTLNYASDERPTKNKARFMLRMVDSLNHVVLPRIPDRHTPPVTVTCITCHRMMPVPTTIENVLVETTESAGVDSAIARYRMLRGDMARGVFDFTERPVIEVARELGEQGKHADAIKLMEMLQEFYPNSVNVDLEIAALQLASGNRDAAIARLRAILTKNPNNRQAVARLRQLGVEP